MLIALLMGLAAIVLESVEILHAIPRRALWMIALSASLLYPAYRIVSPSVTSSVVARPASDVDGGKSIDSSGRATAPFVVTPPEIPVQRVAEAPTPRRFTWPSLADWDRPLRGLWIIGSAGLLGFYGFGCLRLWRVVRHWPAERIDDIDVLVAEHAGPAVVGAFKPKIVIPRWLLNVSPLERAMALAHEREHVSAHDPLLFQMAILLVALAPWNFPLWWQLRRMMFAIEVDCDRRVLRGGCDTKKYGEMLLSINQRQHGWVPGALALTEKTSQLERRIRVMTGAVKRHSGAALIALAGLAVSLIVVAASLDAPKIDLGPPLLHPQSTYMSPLAERARAVSRARFPQLFEQKLDGVAVVVVVFNNDGSLFSATKKEISADALPDTLHKWANSIPAGVEPEDIAAEERGLDAPLGAWADGQNPYRVILVAKVLRWPIDPTRSAAKVKQAALTYFPDLQQAPYHSTILATVFMNEDGTVNRGEKKVLPPGTGFSEDMYPKYSDLGFSPEEIGRKAEIWLQWHPVENVDVSLQYAWPRRIDDRPEDTNPWWSINRPRAPLQETAADRAVVAQYFPDVLENGVRDGNALWALVARDGRILSTGQSFFGKRVPNSLLILWELKARYPGIKVHPCDDSYPVQLSGNSGQKIPLLYACLAIDSPVTDLQHVDLSNRGDVFVGGWVLNRPLASGGAHHNLPFSVTGHFDKPTDSEAVYSVQVIATDVGANVVELKVRQHPYTTSEWSDWSPAIRAVYGDESDVQVPDRDSGRVEMLLRPVRLTP